MGFALRVLTESFRPAFWLAGLLALTACGAGASAVPAPEQAAESPVQSLPLSRTPVYLDLIPAQGGTFAYLESNAEGTAEPALLAELAYLGGDGSFAAAAPILVVKGFAAPLGEAISLGEALLVPVVRQSDDLGAAFELWRVSPAGVAELTLACSLPPLVYGQVLADATSLVVVLEGRDGALWGFGTASSAPSCPAADGLVELQAAPLPEVYALGWAGADVALAGRSGGSYGIRLFDRQLRPLRRVRLASGAARPGLDLWAGEGPDGASMVLFGAEESGAWDLYAAPLEQLAAGPLEAQRAVATADVELQPRAVVRHGAWVISWTVLGAAGERLELAGLWAFGGPALAGGEVVWRHVSVPGAPFASVWTPEGFLRAWIGPAGTLDASLYRPSFW